MPLAAFSFRRVKKNKAEFLGLSTGNQELIPCSALVGTLSLLAQAELWLLWWVLNTLPRRAISVKPLGSN